MYIVIYLYPVPEENLNRVAEILREAAEIMMRHGALSDEVFVLQNTESESQVQSFSRTFAAQAGEVIAAELERFLDKEHQRQVLLNFDADPRVIELYEALNALVPMQRVVLGEFDQVA
jgi:uncharacterized protein YbaA (DUF1428 family)